MQDFPVDVVGVDIFFFDGPWECMKSILITSPAAISTKLTMATDQNELRAQVT